MQASIFLARLLGPVMCVIGVSLAINRNIYTAMSAEFVASRSLVYLAGVAALVAGLSIVLSHNLWAADWRLIITVLGWFATLAGTTRLLFPESVKRFGAQIFKSEKPVFISGLVAAALGAVLCFAGYLR